MGKATLIMRRSASIEYSGGQIVSIRMDLFSIPDQVEADLFRFSWIAFDLVDPERRVLFDSHPPKGPHFHVRDQEASFEWKGIPHALKLFIECVVKEFGDHPDLAVLAEIEGDDSL
jgi:hypothetical protein